MSLAPVLLIEDNLDDVELTRLAFVEAGITHPLVVANDGAIALDWLHGRGVHAGRDATQLPALVLLDLNLPKLDGREVMQAIRADPATRHLPVVALSSSGEPFDIDTSFASGVDSYLQKPVDFERFIEEMKRLRAQWLDGRRGDQA
ncbi:response regulator [Lysobacter sp. KIS68-7]|uniref:response regulator n=1 Tax=Lysobacter sp. KIS68-7 TaxID=2904252 RepID=UPI001E3D80A6|nr:response regulator [Lysobacter sp. KIS68-7]UHQ20420.1 response regulator [Lysobacter sp. KIS68-7]